MTGTIEDILPPADDPAWVLRVEGYDPLRESSAESRFAISNGFLGVRGARSTARGARWAVPARIYVAGLFDTYDTRYAIVGLVPAPDWLRMRILLPGGPLQYHPGKAPLHRIALDLRRGIWSSDEHLVKSHALSLQARTTRLVSLHDRAIGLQVVQLAIERGEVDITFEASFEGMHNGLVPTEIRPDLGVWHTHQSGKTLAIAAASSLQLDGNDLKPTALGDLRWSWSWKTRPGQIVSFQRIVSVVRGDTAEPAAAAQKKLALAMNTGWRGVVASHTAAWDDRWKCSDLQIAGDPDAQLALRFAVYHLNSVANPADERVSIGARALTGDDYHGHVFWDTEIFLLPFYIFTWPEAARAMLMYRFHTLDAARAKATRMGWRGALYAWESADTGEEMTPDQVIGPDKKVVDVLCGRLEQHISADIAYAVWQYWQATADETFLRAAGAEILLETGRFWASRAQRGIDGRYHIRDVIGPDEYHEHIDDNAYTNVMARWNIRRALDVAALLRERWPAQWEALSIRLGLDENELAQWSTVAEAIATGFDPATGLFAQFSGFFGLEDIDLTNYTGRTVPMDVVLGRPRTQNSQVVKQADVVALMALLPEEFPPGTAVSNFRYYEPRCSHGSSLSPAMHGLVAARLGDPEMALRFLRQAAEIDLGDTHVGTEGGVHIAALGGIWMATVFGFAGLMLRDDGIALAPHLPAAWESLTFRVQWRQRRLRIVIDRHTVDVTLEHGEPMMIAVGGGTHQARRDHPLQIPLVA